MFRSRVAVVVGMFPQDTAVLNNARSIADNTARAAKFVETPCDECKAPCWLGPAQQEIYNATAGPVALLCYSCVLFGQNIVIVKRITPEDANKEKPQ